MGRPLYSRTFKTVTPTVREPEEPTYQRWSYLNAFDPDSDDFFDNENAVYEDFIGPITPSENPVQAMNEEEEEDERRRTLDMLVVRLRNASPVSSVSSLSDSDTSLTGSRDDLAADEAQRMLLALRSPRETRRAPQTLDGERLQPRRGLATRAAVRRASYVPYQQRAEPLPVPTRSAPIPVPAVSRRPAVSDDHMLASPATPPHQTPVASSYFPMSPPPSSTPRLYSWARNPSHSTSPSSTGPLTNPHARASYTHLSPAFIRIRDVTV